MFNRSDSIGMKITQLQKSLAGNADNSGNEVAVMQHEL